MDTESLHVILRFIMIGLLVLILLINIYLIIEDYIKDDNFYKQVMSRLKHTVNHVVMTSYDATISAQGNAVIHLGTLIIIYGALVIVAMELILELLSMIAIL